MLASEFHEAVTEIKAKWDEVVGGGGQDTMISETKSKTITVLIQNHLYANYVLGLQTLTGPSGAQKISN